MDDQRTTPPERRPQDPYEPPSVTVLGTIADLTGSNQAGGQPDFPMNAPSTF
jgi:hypothetical protein